MTRLGDVLPGAHVTVSGINSRGTDRMKLIEWRGNVPVFQVLAVGYNGHLAYAIKALSPDSQVVRLY